MDSRNAAKDKLTLPRRIAAASFETESKCLVANEMGSVIIIVCPSVDHNMHALSPEEASCCSISW